MTKILHCRDAGFDCNAVIEGATAEEILEQVRPHAAEAHDTEVTPAMDEQLRSLVQDA